MKPFDAPLSRDAHEPLSNRNVAARPGKKSTREGAVVEAGAADQNWQFAPRGDAANDGFGFPRVSRRRVLLDRIRNVDHVMQNPALLNDLDFVGADIESPVYRGRVACDDLAVMTLGD